MKRKAHRLGMTRLTRTQADIDTKITRIMSRVYQLAIVCGQWQEVRIGGTVLVEHEWCNGKRHDTVRVRLTGREPMLHVAEEFFPAMKVVGGDETSVILRFQF